MKVKDLTIRWDRNWRPRAHKVAHHFSAHFCLAKTPSIAIWGQQIKFVMKAQFFQVHSQVLSKIPFRAPANCLSHDAPWRPMMHHEHLWCILNTHDASSVLMMHHEYSWCIMSTHDASWVLMMHHEYSWCIRFVTKWHAMEVKRILTRQTSIILGARLYGFQDFPGLHASFSDFCF